MAVWSLLKIGDRKFSSANPEVPDELPRIARRLLRVGDLVSKMVFRASQKNFCSSQANVSAVIIVVFGAVAP